MSQEPNNQPQPPTSEGNGERPPIDFVAVAREMFVLTLGLLIGFVWTMLASGADDKSDFEIYNMFIGLVIITCVLIRYLYLVKYKSQIVEKKQLLKQFLIEVGVLIPSMMLGLLWFLWYDAESKDSVHLVMLMVVIVYGLARLVIMISQKPEA